MFTALAIVYSRLSFRLADTVGLPYVFPLVAVPPKCSWPGACLAASCNCLLAQEASFECDTRGSRCWRSQRRATDLEALRRKALELSQSKRLFQNCLFSAKLCTHPRFCCERIRMTLISRYHRFLDCVRVTRMFASHMMSAG